MVASMVQVCRRAALVGATMMLGATACYFDVGGPPPPASPIPILPEAAAELRALWQSAVAEAIDGQFTIIITETQLTSLLAERLARHQNPLLQDPQVFLRDGLMQLYGTALQGPFRATILIAIQPSANPEGGLELNIVSAQFGPSPSPQALIDAISGVLTEAFTGSIGSLATGIKIISVAIHDGEMTLVASIR